MNEKIMQLHLEISPKPERKELNILKKYGKVTKSLSRDILVSAEMPLHNLHYAIQKLFGWRNSHLHSFSYDRDIFEELTKNDFNKWLDLCGVYFRFPDDETSDHFWDDDYDGTVDPKTWLRRKYSEPYIYRGFCEHYMPAQNMAREFIANNKEITVMPSFEEFLSSDAEPKVMKLADATLDEFHRSLEGRITELLERLPVGNVISIKKCDISELKTESSETVYNENCFVYKRIMEQFDKIDELSEKQEKHYSGKRAMELRSLSTEAYKLFKDLYSKTDKTVVPLSDKLLYSYDFGDGWEIEITCSDIFEHTENGFIGSKGKTASEERAAQLSSVKSKHRPICIMADGLPLMDNVGGIGGYCEFLQTINGSDKEEKLYMKEWASDMGWTGRMVKPENIL
ncbi:MAG: hypothetical protein SOT68_00745 [Oscillospiraceae bacterium]|nr:plasmid pRiA4b ORF-3 family protein [Oscillospiraceae bacterium]MDY2862704.1 hypothetical protein [Oscillospiraceae bacterium]